MRYSPRAPTGRLFRGVWYFGPPIATINGRGVNRVLKSSLTNAGAPKAERQLPHAFRRGATKELAETGSPRSVVAASGIWRPPAPRGYVDMPTGIELVARHIFGGDFDSEPDTD